MLPTPAAATDDHIPTPWMQQIRSEWLLTAPPPPNPVEICVIDTGVDITPDLAHAIVGRTAVDGGDPGDVSPEGHGTLVATIIAGAVNGWGSAGVWPQAKIYSVRAFDNGQSGTADNVHTALGRCLQRPAVRVVNLSVEGMDGSEAALAEVASRLEEAKDAQVATVVAAGNSVAAIQRVATMSWPIAVAGVTLKDALCATSSRGPAVDIHAPGCDLMMTSSEGSEITATGTSFAAPVVSAALAAVMAYTHTTAAHARQTLLDRARTADSGRVLDVHGALEGAGFGTGGQHNSNPQPVHGAGAGGTVPDDEDDPEATLEEDSAGFRLPRPRVQVRKKSRHLVVLRFLNKPPDAIVEVRRSARSLLTGTTSHRVRIKRLAANVKVRYVRGVRTSRWARLRLRTSAFPARFE